MANETAKRARVSQQELPGTDDSAIQGLEAKAKQLRTNRDEINELKAEGAKLEQALIALMHKHGKKTYRRHGIEIVVVGSTEKIKVRYPDDSDENED